MNLGGFGFLGSGATASPPPGHPNGERNGSRPARRGSFTAVGARDLSIVRHRHSLSGINPQLAR
eukprot:160074-Prymnesium_polylepis.1